MENLVVGIARFEVRIPGSRSLKARRRVTQRIRDRLRARHNVSVAEVGGQDERDRVVFGLAMVGSDARLVGSSLEKLLDTVEAMHVAPVVARHVETTTYGDAFSHPHLEDLDRW